MKFDQFEIGKKFYGGGGFQWLCTDKGTRTITAIMLDPEKDPLWFAGPPYAVNEEIFDEHDIQSCLLNEDDWILQLKEEKKSYHPNFASEDVNKMMKERFKSERYYNKNIMKNDRVTKAGEVLHPYAASRKEDGWYIKTFESFSRVYDEIHENEFVKLPISTENDLKNRELTMESKI